VKKAGSGHFAEHTAGISWKPLGQLGPTLPIEGPPWFQVVSTVEYAADHIPLGQAE
jgi:hypothetical protein